MRRLSCLAAVALLTACGAFQAHAGDKTDKDLIQGSWELVSMTFKGMELPLPKDGEMITFKGDKATSKQSKDDPADFKLDPTKKPKEIDITPKKGPVRGIYELTGDTLKIAMSAAKESERPKGFTGDDVVVMTLKKKKA